MQRYTNYATDRQGNAQQGVAITAYEAFTAGTGSEVPVQMYEQNGANPVAQVVTDTEGRFDFYVANDRIDIKLVLGGSIVILKDQLSFDPEDVGIAIDSPFDAEATVWHNGDGPPDPGLGDDNDYYLDDLNGDYYTKTAGAWGAPEGNLTGPVGPVGITPTGPWDVGRAYVAREAVIFNGDGYYTPVPVAAGVSPPNAPWILYVLKGDDAGGTITGDHALFEHKRVILAADSETVFDVSPLVLQDERQLMLYRNGVRQVPSDFDLTGASEVTFYGALFAGDILDFFVGTGTLDGSMLYQLSAEKDQPDGYAGLDSGGKLNASQIPALALTEVHVVADEAAQLALDAQEGDVAVRTDQNRSYIHNGGTAGTMADWTELQSPTDAVQSVFGRTGAVVALVGDYAAFYEPLNAQLAKLNVNQTWAKAQRSTITALTDGATITPDFNDSNDFAVTLEGNRALANPSNVIAGQSGVIYVVQDGTGGRTLSFGTNYKFRGGVVPVLSTAANAVDRLVYHVRNSTFITLDLQEDYK